MSSLLLLAVFVLAVALTRTRRELEHTRDDLGELSRRVDALALGGREAKAPPPASPVEAGAAPVEPPAPTAPEAREEAPSVRIADSASWPEPAPPPALPRPRARPEAPAVETPTRPPIEWERWLGVRGAAVAGGAVMILAFLYFVRVSIERGWITPGMRFVLGTVTGIAALVGSELLTRRKLNAAADALAGAGAAGLYAVFWAGLKRWELLSSPVAFGLMALVTVVCGLTAVRRGSLVVAVLGLLGGFATPFLVSTGSDRPVALFSYVAVLNLGLLAVAMKRRWPRLALLGVAATAIVEAGWLLRSFEPGRLALALVSFGGLGAIFAVAGLFAPEKERRSWLPAQALGLLAPVLFAFHFAARADLGPELWPLGLYLGLLGLAASWIGRRNGVPVLGIAMAAGTVAAVAVWSGQHLDRESLPGAAAVLVALAVAHHAVVERRAAPDANLAAPALTIAFGFLVVLLPYSLSPHSRPLVFPLTAAALGALTWRQGRRIGEERIELAAPLAVMGLVGLRFTHVADAAPWRELGLLLLAAIVPQLAAIAARTSGRAHRFAEMGAFATAMFALPSYFLGADDIGSAWWGPARMLGPLALFTALAVAAAVRTGRGGWFAAAVALSAVASTAWQLLVYRVPWTGGALALHALAVVGLAGAPFLGSRRLLGTRLGRATSAGVPVLWFAALYALVHRGFGERFIALTPLALAAVGVGAAALARRVPLADDTRRSVLVWHLATALGFVSIAIPLQVDREWLTIGWALESLALVELYRRLRHPGLKWLAAALATIVGVRLCANPAVLAYHDAGGTPILNWLLYTYGVPAAAFAAMLLRLAPIETGSLTSRERSLVYTTDPPRRLISGLAGFLTVLLVFVWLNLTIAHAYQESGALSLDFSEYSQAHNLTASITWALYALVLLAIGMARRVVPLRWVSLVVLLLALSKVFLFDLRNLGDLYRVAALAGLAISLLAVSLAYQRFVFREPR